MIVDAHVHASETWFEPVGTVLHQMDLHGVRTAVLTALLGQHDNRYLLECAARHPGRFRVVAGVDAAAPTACEDLTRLVDSGVCGIRLRATARSTGPDPLALWRAAARLRLPVSVVGRWPELTAPAFAELLAAVPGLVVVLEHLGAGPTPDRDAADVTGRAAVFELARFEGVHIKVTGLGEFAERGRPDEADPFARPIPAYLPRVVELFGPARMMWGSDFPPVAAREGYGNALRWCRAELAALPERDVAAIFGGTAARVFRPAGQTDSR